MQNLEFQKTVLPNGFTIYSHLDPSVEFAHMAMVTPVGSLHNNGDIIPGTFHFIEHLLAGRSQKYPEIFSNTKAIQILGGFKNAMTSQLKTSYTASIPTLYVKDALEMIMSSFFEPHIEDLFVQKEKGIIANERKRRENFFPESTEIDQYAVTQWMYDVPCPVEQIFGSDIDFEKMNAQYFHFIHETYYTTKRNYFVIAGNFNFDQVCSMLGKVQLHADFVIPDKKEDALRWEKPEFHIFETKNVSRFEYNFGWLYAFDGSVFDTMHQINNSSIIQILNSPAYGAIFNWLRNEKQWIYEIKRKTSTWRGRSRNSIVLPLNSMNQVTEIRNEFKDRCYDALSCQKTLEFFKQQRRGERVFSYETIKSRMDRVLADLDRYGAVQSIENEFDIIENLSTNSLRDFFENNIIKNFGEMVFVPKK